MRKGIVGNGADKFTELGRDRAKQIIYDILEPPEFCACEGRATYPCDGPGVCADPTEYNHTVVSGHSPVGGVDIWAEEVGEVLGCILDIKEPEIQQWNPEGGYGYKARNIDIAEDSDELHVIIARNYPPDYQGRRFDLCYHCMTNDHVKSGACWTAKQAIRMGKDVSWHYVDNE